jgi:SAM-dependent methyltransferase
MLNRGIGKTYIHVPVRPGRTVIGVAVHAIKGILLGPLYWGLAALLAAPGMSFRARCFWLGLRALFGLEHRLSLSTIFHLLFMPMESTRYFEFDFVWKTLAQRPLRRYLDVSSPRLLPVSLIEARPALAADLINPNVADLEDTRRFINFIGAAGRCTLRDCLITDAPLAPGTFDVVTSISVLEHIPDDVAAVRRIWELLRPGGMLVLTLPCMARAAEQFIDRDEWGLLEKDQQGHVFWQRFYDQDLLERNIFQITGKPQEVRIYGEKLAGSFFANAARKRSDPAYPYWREPYMMAKDYRYFDSLEQLPGEGVIGCVFAKPE